MWSAGGRVEPCMAKGPQNVHATEQQRRGRCGSPDRCSLRGCPPEGRREGAAAHQQGPRCISAWAGRRGSQRRGACSLTALRAGSSAAMVHSVGDRGKAKSFGAALQPFRNCAFSSASPRTLCAQAYCIISQTEAALVTGGLRLCVAQRLSTNRSRRGRRQHRVRAPRRAGNGADTGRSGGGGGGPKCTGGVKILPHRSSPSALTEGARWRCLLHRLRCPRGTGRTGRCRGRWDPTAKRKGRRRKGVPRQHPRTHPQRCPAPPSPARAARARGADEQAHARASERAREQARRQRRSPPRPRRRRRRPRPWLAAARASPSARAPPPSRWCRSLGP